MAVVEYTNLSGPVETGAYNPIFQTGVVGYSPNNDNIYIRAVPENSNISSGSPSNEGAVQIINSDGINKKTVKMISALYAAYAQESDYDPNVTLTIDNGNFVDQRIYADNTGYIYTHVEVEIDSTPQHYMMTSQDDGDTWIGYRLPQNRWMVMEFNSRPIR